MDFGVILTEVLALGLGNTHPGLSADHDIPLPLYSKKKNDELLLSLLKAILLLAEG